MVKHAKFGYHALLHNSVDLLLPFVVVFGLLTVKRGKPFSRRLIPVLLMTEDLGLSIP